MTDRMMTGTFRSRLLNGEVLIGTMVTLPSTFIERGYTLIAAGVDTLFLGGAQIKCWPMSGSLEHIRMTGAG
jgi:hypothetical protein